MYILTLYAWIATIRTLLNKTPKQSVPRTTPKRHRYTVLCVCETDDGVTTLSFNVLSETEEHAAERGEKHCAKHKLPLTNVFVLKGYNAILYMW